MCQGSLKWKMSLAVNLVNQGRIQTNKISNDEKWSVVLQGEMKDVVRPRAIIRALRLIEMVS